VTRATDGREACIVILSGRADIAGGEEEWRGLGSRETVFDGPPDAVYVPPGLELTITGASDSCEVALVLGAPRPTGGGAARIAAGEIKRFKRGSAGPRGDSQHPEEDRPASPCS